jgi:uncharacterized small protein (DUF1192 family)
VATEPDARGERPDTDDYDLLTYGEASARLAELLAAERDKLAALRQQADPDPAIVQHIEERIALLQSSDGRYRRQALSAEAFTRRFGFIPRDTQAQDSR